MSDEVGFTPLPSKYIVLIRLLSPSVKHARVTVIDDAPGFPDGITDDAGNTWYQRSREAHEFGHGMDVWWTLEHREPPATKVTLHYESPAGYGGSRVYSLDAEFDPSELRDNG